MNPVTSADVQTLIDKANAQIALLDKLLTSQRPQVIQSIVYNGAKFYLQLLIAVLTSIRDWLKAVEDIQQRIGE